MQFNASLLLLPWHFLDNENKQVFIESITEFLSKKSSFIGFRTF